MSKSIEKLKFILEKIDDLLSYKTQYSTIEELLNSKMGFDATLMALLQIGETLNKLKDSPYSDKLPIKGAYDVRNFIAHDYEGVNKVIIEDIIRRFIPELKSIILGILDKS
jgi:uncharacterized protein with HEPN domain